jgi:uncharacterized protein (DUF2235 family)
VCCDGTWNRPDQLSPTNVSKVALAIAEEDGDGTRQLLFYQPGIGTRPFERLRGGAFGAGLGRNIQACYRWLVDHYDEDDELFFFGFSRGAYTARSTVGLVRNSGILHRDQIHRIDDAYALYRSRDPERRPRGDEAKLFRRTYSHPEPPIHFIGVWDTVGALGIPIPDRRWLKPLTKRWTFHDTKLSSHVRAAYQALAIDEDRELFEATIWEQQPEGRAKEQVVEQVWFAGDHCDVGGGHVDHALSDIALLWLVGRARDNGLAFDEPTDDLGPRPRGQDVDPDACGILHNSFNGLFKVLGRERRMVAGDGAFAASSAIRRMQEPSCDYAPQNLQAFLADGGPEMTVVNRCGSGPGG